MSEERLEEIVEKISEQTFDRIIVPQTKITIEYQDIKFLINAITKQDERVQELKRLMDYQQKYGQKQLDEAVDAFRYYKSKSKSYRETLEFYANPRNYGLSAEAERAVLEFINVVDKDSGEKARKALGGE